MKYAIFTFEGNGFSIAKHLIEEGCDVIVGQVTDYTKTIVSQDKKLHEKEDSREKKLRMLYYKNIVDRIPADVLLAKLLRVKNPQDYFIFFDSNNLFYYADKLQNKGFHGNFPTEENRLFEIKRNIAKQFVTQHYPNLKITENYGFKSVQKAIEFLKDSPHVWVLKSQTDSIPTFVPDTDNPAIAKKQIIENLKVFADYYHESGFLLEVKIPTIMEYIPEKMYYNGVPLFTTVMIENKYIGSGNLSFQVGCAGDIVFPISMKSKMHDLAFPPFVDELAKQHKGLFIWDASLMIDPATGDVYFGEFCPNRPGYNCTYTMLEQMPSVHHFFEKVVKQQNPFPAQTVGASVMLFNLSRDPETDHVLSDASIIYSRENEKHIWAYDIYKKTKQDITRTVGYDHHLSPITAAGTSLRQAVDRLYRNVDDFKMGALYYRPKFDFLSLDYSTSIMNRLRYGIDHNLFDIPFILDI